MPASRNEIVKFCQEFLQADQFQDYCHNGLQVEGTDTVKKIIVGVSLSKQLIEAAIKKDAQMLLVHHGLFGDQIGTPPVIKGVIKNRIKLLMARDINLVGFHLPLDAHPEIGNNISLCELLGVNNAEPMDVGFIGQLAEPVDFETFVETVNKELGAKSYVIAAGPKQVSRVGIISGGSSPDALVAAELGADTYIGGDIRENVVREVEEAGINFINAGHYNTEKLGIQNLGQRVAKKFKVEVEFVEVPNEI